MGAPKRTLPPALAANRWRPGPSGNPSGLSGEYGEAVRIARSYAPAAMYRLAELAELHQTDEQGQLIPLAHLKDVDRRVVAVAVNGLLDRALGKPKEPKDASKTPLRSLPPDQQRKRIAELLALAASIKVPADFRPADVIDAEPADNDDEGE
jgi:hypothetical protein